MKHLYHFVTIILILFLVLILNQKYYKEETKENDLNTYLSVIINGEEKTEFPSKESGLKVKEITCNNETEIYWDYEAWGPVIKKLSKNNTKCSFTFASEYSESILNGTDPVLKDGLIPVTISDDGTVKRARLSEEWYDYETQKWANAVILEDESKKYYEGEIIPENNIESYFVWIPKYRYKLWDLGKYNSLSTSVQKKEQTIDIIFGEYDTIDKEGECKTPGVSGEIGNCKVGDYMTHPAFTAFGTNGLWVGKFETGYKGATTSAAGAQLNGYDPSKVIIKPNVYNWRGANVSNAHLNSYNYKREYDSHMMKNTEWGAVAYLQHSLYGSRQSVRINNNSSQITGYAAKNEPTTGYTGTNIAGNIQESTALGVDGTNTYNYFSANKDSEGNIIADLASTTANKSGIYDMSGGAWEYVMGVMMYSDNVTLCAGMNSAQTSGFVGRNCESANAGSVTNGIEFPTSRYYDAYAYGEAWSQFQRGILGDATSEMGPFAYATYGSSTIGISSWHTDSVYFVNPYTPCFTRGAHSQHGLTAGMFAFSSGFGGIGGAFRIVLAI